MDARLESIVSAIPADDFTIVARGAIGSPSASLTGPPVISEITNPHLDPRTIGIVKAQGSACDDDAALPWSSVGKLTSNAEDEIESTNWLKLETEQIVYENHLFTGDDLSLRPARCYLISRPAPDVTLIWLEDLSEAAATPFNLDQLLLLACHLGEFNGFHANHNTEPPIKLSHNGYRNRWESSPLLKRADELQSMAGRQAIRQAFGTIPTVIMADLGRAIALLVDRALELPHALAFGDSQPGNFFINDDETVAIDWSGMAIDPMGVDPGTLVGSALAWGTKGGELAANERRIFDGYVEGLHKGGWTGANDDVRRAYLCTFGLYLMHMGSTIPMTVAGPGSVFAHQFIEGRFGCELNEIPVHLSPIIQLIPDFLEEIRQLAK